MSLAGKTNAEIAEIFKYLHKRNKKTMIENGGRISVGMSEADWLPDLAKQMVSTAEESGSLPQVLLRVSDYYHKELERLLQRFSKMVEPIMLVVMKWGSVAYLLYLSWKIANAAPKSPDAPDPR